MRKTFEAAHVIPRPGRPEDVAAAAAFLFSDDAAFRTGEILPVDSGWNTQGSAG
ncbi:SDR family oxidoreductase [Actinomycetospora lemnae]|uniref:SDR family oxidoreductase n=1 Tax=Actinomycetospora lemnae TaxID=3019891 RepID=A0ABT5SRC6_9PSEU|nr:SDR family oxidoreductase [Actinomycetospora sp. DW7H6]MDD7965395.1 SDR family oxidoreductase [Actinomycetospora sp. DW7H6]